MSFVVSLPFKMSYMGIVPTDSHIALHRAQLIDMLKSRLPTTCTVHTSKTLASYTRNTDINSSYILRFTDGTTANSDVLIGADGVRSTVRKGLFRDLREEGKYTNRSLLGLKTFVESQWSGTIVYRSLIQPQKLRKISPDHPLFTAKAPLNVCSSASLLSFL